MIKTVRCKRCRGTGREFDLASVGEQMARFRKRAGLSGREMARRLGISAMYLCDLERGRRQWNREFLTNYKKCLRNLPVEKGQHDLKRSGNSDV